MLLANTSDRHLRSEFKNCLDATFLFFSWRSPRRHVPEQDLYSTLLLRESLSGQTRRKGEHGRGLESFRECHHPQLSHLGGVYLCLCMVHECVLECVVSRRVVEEVYTHKYLGLIFDVHVHMWLLYHHCVLRCHST